MSLNYTTFGARIGVLADLDNKIRTVMATTLPTEIDDVLAEYSDADKDLVANLLENLPIQQASLAELLGEVRMSAERTLVEMVSDGVGTPTTTIYDALIALIRDMEKQSESVAYSTVSATPSYSGSIVGTGKVVASVADGRGYRFVNIRAETMRGYVIADAANGASSGREVWEFRGERAVPNDDYSFPAGSGIVKRVPTSTASDSNGRSPGKNILSNSNFEVFSTDTPVFWSLDVGTTTTHTNDTTTALRGTKALELIGDGSTLTTLRQTFRSASGSLSSLKPLTRYAMSVWVRDDGTTPGAGVLRIRLVDGSNSLLTALATMSVDLTSVGSTYAHSYALFSTPANIPSTCKMEVALSTALTTGRSVYIDELQLVEMTPLSPSGPQVAIFAGGTDFKTDDYVDIAVANNRTSTANGAVSLAFDKWFGMWGLGLQLPNSGSPTIADSVIA